MSYAWQSRIRCLRNSLSVWLSWHFICAYGNSMKSGHVHGGQSVHDGAIICRVKKFTKKLTLPIAHSKH